MKREMLILALLILAFFTVSGVYASDFSDALGASEDMSEIEASQNDDATMELNQDDDLKADYLVNGEDGETESTGIGAAEYGSDGSDGVMGVAYPDDSFSALNETINGNTDSEVNLTNDYKFYSAYDGKLINGILINRKVTINGNGHTIDSKEVSRQFDVEADGVIIKNLTFKNSHYHGIGGAIYFSDSGEVICCNFVNNKGGSAGAIWFQGNAIVKYCNFTNNSASDSEGAICLRDGGIITNCNFNNNNAVYGIGGAVGCGEYTTIENCNFTDNSAVSWGGAVFLAEGGSITNSNFNNNHLSAGSGGAIYYYQGESSVTDCVFINNNASNFAAVHLSSGVGNISGCLFINNSAELGVVGQAWDSYTRMDVNNNIFLNNDVTNNVIDFADIGLLNTDYNWFGSTADNYNERIPSETSKIWLFMNATVNPNPVSLIDSSEIVFKLYSYIKNSGNVSQYNNNLLKQVNLTITKTNGGTDRDKANLGEAIEFYPARIGTGSVKAALENVKYAIKFEIIADPGLSVNPQEIYYSNNTVIAINYNSTATGKVNITLNGKRFNYTFTDLDLNPTVSLGRVNPDEYNITVTYSGDGTFSNATARSTLTVNPIVDLSVNITAKKDVLLIGKYAYWTVTVSNAGNGTNATGVTLDVWFPFQYFRYIGYDISKGSFDQQFMVWNIGFMENGTNATLHMVGIAKVAKNQITNRVLVVCNETDWNISNNWAYSYVDVENLNSTVDLNNTETVYGNAVNVTVKTEGATGITAKINGSNATVDGFTIEIPVMDAGIYNLTVTTITDENHTAATKTVNLTVNRAPCEIIIANSTLDVKALNSISAGATLNPGKAGNLTYYSSNSSVAIVSGDVIMAVGKGQTVITVSFNGTRNYAAAENRTITVNVALNDASISVDNDTLDLKVGDSYAINATTVPSIAKQYNLTYVSSNESVATVTDYGIVTAVGEGTTTITLTVGNDVTYAVNTTNVTVTVSKIPTEITVDTTPLDLFVGDEIVIVANLTPAGAGNVTFTSSDYDVVDFDFEGNVIAQGKGQAIITVSFAGDDKYAAAENKTIIINVSLDNASVTVDNNTLDLKVGETSAINAIKHPDTIMLSITYTSSNNSVVTVDKKGIVTAVGEGTAVITVEVGDDEIYAKNSTTVNVTVSKVSTEIESSAVTTVYNVDKNLIVTLKDADGKPISGASITVDLNGDKTYSTDKKGQITVSTKGLAPKAYTAKITFKGNSTHDKSTKDVKVTVKKATPKITAKAKTFKTTTKTKKYSIVLKNNVNKPIKKATVYLKVSGKTYKATTNSKGKATFKITNLNKKGTYKATVTYKGNKYYNKATKKVTIKVKSVWKTVSKGSKNSAIVKKIQRALKNHGYYLEYNGRYLMVDGIYWDYTEMAVKEFQNDKVLKVTGKVDEKTAKKLGIIK